MLLKLQKKYFFFPIGMHQRYLPPYISKSEDKFPTDTIQDFIQSFKTQNLHTGINHDIGNCKEVEYYRMHIASTYRKLKLYENNQRFNDTLENFRNTLCQRTALREAKPQFWKIHEAHVLQYLTFSSVFSNPIYEQKITLCYPCNPSSSGHDSLFNFLVELSKLNFKYRIPEFEAIEILENNLSEEALNYLNTIEKLSLQYIITKLKLKFCNFPSLTDYLNSVKQEWKTYEIQDIRFKINEVLFMLKYAYKREAVQSCLFYENVLYDCFITPIGCGWEDIYRIINQLPLKEFKYTHLVTPPELIVLLCLLHLEDYIKYKNKYKFVRYKSPIKRYRGIHYRGIHQQYSFEINNLNMTADFIMLLNHVKKTGRIITK